MTLAISIDNISWTQVNSDLVGTISNLRERDVLLRELPTQPDSSVLTGHTLRPGSPIPFTLAAVDNLWARSVENVGQVVVSVGVGAIMDTVLRDKWLAAFETTQEGDTALGVFVQDQTTPNINLILDSDSGLITLSSDTVLDSTTITLAVGHGVVVGEFILLQKGENVSQFEVLAVVTNTITLDSPVDHIYTSAGTIARRTTTNMSVVGTLSTPVIFSVKPISGQKWDITRVIFVIESTANNMDFTGFGSISPLTNGCVLRKKDGDRQNIFNWKSNGDIIHRGFDHQFEGKTGGGGSGFVVRTSFAGQDKQGVVIRLDGDLGEELQVLIQDDISDAALTKVIMIAQGHLVQ